MSPGRASERVVDRAHAAALVRRWREAGERVVLVVGGFDLLEVGHVRALAAARSGAARLVVAVRDDAALARGGAAGAPVLPAAERAALVAALRGVDLVCVVDDATPEALAGRLGAHEGREVERELDGGPRLAERVRERHAGGR